jgi:hypothetical protein
VRPSLRQLAALLAAALLAAGCASGGASSASTRSQHNVITAAELSRAGDVSLYDALEKLRPAMLRSHGGAGVMTGERTLQVYVGDQHLEGVDALRSILARTVKEVHFLEPQQANARFGENNAGGAIVVTLL